MKTTRSDSPATGHDGSGVRAGRRLARASVGGAMLLAGLGIAACGGAAAPTIINGEKIERAIEHSSLAQRHEHVQVSCPSGVQQKKGLTFVCEAINHSGPVAKRVTTRFVVTQLDSSGHVHYKAG